MNIKIHTEWVGQTQAEVDEQLRVAGSLFDGDVGHLAEVHEGFPHATQYLVAEAFVNGRAKIPAEILKSRLELALHLAESRGRDVYNQTDETIEELQNSFIGFVAFCERSEKRTGRPVTVVAMW